MKRSLILNSDWTPLNFVSAKRAISLLFNCRAEVITLGESPSFWDETMDTVDKKYEVPATVRLLATVTRRFSTPRFRKSVLFNRDAWQCQYCDVKLSWQNVTVDHIVPRSRGGRDTWKNCVTSCKRCNTRKGSRMLHESGMRLKKIPTEPRVTHFWEDLHNPTAWHPDWDSFFSRR